MTRLNFAECWIVLKHLVVEERGAVLSLGRGDLQLQAFEALYDEANDRAARQEIIKAATLKERCTRHSQLTTQLANALSAHRDNPLNSEARQDAASRLYRMLVAGRTGAAHSASARVQYGDKARGGLPRLRADLQRFPARDGVSALSDLVERWLSAATDIEVALVAIAYRPLTDPRSVGAITRDVNAALSLLRQSVVLEQKLGAPLPYNIHALLFGLAESLVKARRRRTRKPAPIIAASAETPAEKPRPGRQAPVGRADPDVGAGEQIVPSRDSAVRLRPPIVDREAIGDCGAG